MVKSKEKPMSEATNTDVVLEGADAPVETFEPASVKKVRIILDESETIPPTGLFIAHNGVPYVLRAGIEAEVPEHLLRILDDARISMPVIDPQTQQVLEYRERPRYAYRRV